MARYQGLTVDIKSLLEKLKSSLEKRGYKIERVLTGETSFLIEYKKPGVFGAKETISVKGVPDDFMVSGIREDNQEAWFIVEDVILASAKNPQAFKSHTETMAVPPTPTVPAAPIPQPSAPVQPQPPPPPKPKLEACMHCGAPLTYNPEEILVVCNYCGYVNNTTGEQPPRCSMLPILLTGSQVLEIAKNHVAKGILVTRGMTERAEWGAILLRYVPNWAVTVQLEGELEGKKALVKAKDTKSQLAQEVAMQALGGALGSIFGGAGKGAGKALADRKERVSVSETMDVLVVARKAAQYQPDVGAYKIPLDRKEPFKKTGEETLNVEISAQEAKEKAKGLALQELRSRYTFVSDFDVAAYPMEEPELIYAPWWFIEYRMGGRSFSVIVDACNGNVIAGQRPWIPKGVI
jgi:hypothetical protein